MHQFFVANYEEHLHIAFWNCPVLHCLPGNGLHHHFSEKITRFGWRRNNLNQDLVLACIVIPLNFKDLNRIKSFLVWFIWSEWQGLGALPLSLYSHVGWCRSVKRFWVDLQYQILQLQRAGVVISHEQSHTRSDLWNILHVIWCDATDQGLRIIQLEKFIWRSL